MDVALFFGVFLSPAWAVGAMMGCKNTEFCGQISVQIALDLER